MSHLRTYKLSVIPAQRARGSAPACPRAGVSVALWPCRSLRPGCCITKFSLPGAIKKGDAPTSSFCIEPPLPNKLHLLVLQECFREQVWGCLRRERELPCTKRLCIRIRQWHQAMAQIVHTGGDCVGSLHCLHSVSTMQVVSTSPVTWFTFSSGTKPTWHEQSAVQKESVGSLMQDATGKALASHFLVVASPSLVPSVVQQAHRGT